ncbi:hypothetical protein Tco_0596959 [Tanacetum coccineum]
MASTRASISKASKRPIINIIPPKQLFVDLNQDDIKTPSPKHQLSSPSAPNAPLKTPSTKGTSSSPIDYTPKSPTSSTSLSTNGYLNSPTSLPPRVPPPPPTQENASMDITFTLSPITPLDVKVEGWNEDEERKELWKDLEIYKKIIGNEPWFLSRYLNVTLKPSEHSVGGSNMSNDMKDFHNCVNQIEVEDITWKNGDVFENVKRLRDVVKDIQQKIEKDPYSHDLRSEEANMLKMYTEVMKDEEHILFQKAKVKWLSVGDINNAYFHKTIKSRQQRNIINVACDDNGNRFEGADVADQFHKQHKLSNEEAEYMIREVNDEEIKNAMFQIDDNKAPGPDGYSSSFFKKTWSIIGKDVCHAVKIFFEARKILKEINSTLIALVPKI